MDTKEARDTRGDEENVEFDVGEWRMQGKIMGRAHAIANVGDVADTAGEHACAKRRQAVAVCRRSFFVRAVPAISPEILIPRGRR